MAEECHAKYVPDNWEKVQNSCEKMVDSYEK